MKKLPLLLSTAILVTIFGCSEESQKNASSRTPDVVQASVARINTPPLITQAVSLPAMAGGQVNPLVWRAAEFKDSLGSAVTIKGTSVDGRFDLVILKKGTSTFVSFVQHERWESLHNRPAKGKLISLRIKFDDGPEKLIEWDELGLDTGNLYSVLWSYPAKANAPTGPAPKGSKLDPPEGDERLLQDMMKHKTMLLEVEPGAMTRFEMIGLAHEIQKVRTTKIQPVLDARPAAG